MADVPQAGLWYLASFWFWFLVTHLVTWTSLFLRRDSRQRIRERQGGNRSKGGEEERNNGGKDEGREGGTVMT